MMHNLSKGTVGEQLALAKFLNHGFDVFAAAADISGVDFVIDCAPFSGTVTPLTIQVKSTNDHAKKGYRISRDLRPVDYFFLIDTKTEQFWVVPCNHVQKAMNSLETSETIKDLIWKPSELDLLPFAEFRGIKEIVGGKSPKFHATRIGKAGEALAAAWLTEKGYLVYPTITDKSGVDMVVESKGSIRFVQVKYSRSGPQFRNVKPVQNVPANQLWFLLIEEHENGRNTFFVQGLNLLPNVGSSGSIYLSKDLQKTLKAE